MLGHLALYLAELTRDVVDLAVFEIREPREMVFRQDPLRLPAAGDGGRAKAQAGMRSAGGSAAFGERRAEGLDAVVGAPAVFARIDLGLQQIEASVEVATDVGKRVLFASDVTQSLSEIRIGDVVERLEERGVEDVVDPAAVLFGGHLNVIVTLPI